MDSDVFTDQGGLPIHGIRDVGSTVDGKQHDWSEQAEATETDTLSTDLKSYSNNNFQLPTPTLSLKIFLVRTHLSGLYMLSITSIRASEVQ